MMLIVLDAFSKTACFKRILHYIDTTNDAIYNVIQNYKLHDENACRTISITHQAYKPQFWKVTLVVWDRSCSFTCGLG